MLCFETCLFMYQKKNFKVKIYKTKMLFFLQKKVLQRTCECAWSKRFYTQQCVASSFNAQYQFLY
ncbi:hypothetical protein AB205_0025780 [Aquarana catesbeiana]|uniref:Uncharacterized protein n=1 Tax=Aquarana catesbeiana TaxID=8400 RepID=A0A2G9R6M3_AQUCT|nr:hypothetical protein AB205_0025780 [Aquarana catesbeiana]